MAKPFLKSFKRKKHQDAEALGQAGAHASAGAAAAHQKQYPVSVTQGSHVSEQAADSETRAETGAEQNDITNQEKATKPSAKTASEAQEAVETVIEAEAETPIAAPEFDAERLRGVILDALYRVQCANSHPNLDTMPSDDHAASPADDSGNSLAKDKTTPAIWPPLEHAQNKLPEQLLAYRAFYAQHYGYDASNTHARSALPHFFTVAIDCGETHYDVIGQLFLPKVESYPQPKATVLLLHGYYDHVALYQHTIEHLLAQGFAVISYDAPGHGLSSGARASIESFDDYQQVLQQVIQVMQSIDALPTPYILMGQSMGGAMCMEYLRQRQEQAPFDSVLLFAPLVRPQRWSKAKWLFHGVKQIRFIKQTPRQFTINSHDKAFLRFLQHDPLQPRVLPVAWVNAMRDWFLDFEKTETPLDVTPITVIQAEADGTVNWAHNLPIIQRMFPKITVTMIDDARHQMMNESPPYRDSILRALDEALSRY